MLSNLSSIRWRLALWLIVAQLGLWPHTDLGAFIFESFPGSSVSANRQILSWRLYQTSDRRRKKWAVESQKIRRSLSLAVLTKLCTNSRLIELNAELCGKSYYFIGVMREFLERQSTVEEYGNPFQIVKKGRLCWQVAELDVNQLTKPS